MSYIPRNLDDEIKALNLATHELPLQDLIEFVVHILMKLPSIRSEKEVEILRQYMNKNSFFTSIIKKFGDQVANEIFVLLEHRVLKAGQPLYTAGNVGQSAFILLKGAVEYPVKLEPGTDQSGFMKAKCIEKTTGAVFGDFRKADEETVNNDTLLICRQDSHFAVFSKKEYDKIATFYKIKIMQDQIAFLLSLPIFQGWQPHHMKQWLDIFEKKTYKRKAVVYKQNDPSNHIYIIKSGSVLCNKVIPIKANLLGGHEVGVDEENNVFLVDNRLLCRTVEVAVLGQGQILGDEEALDMYSIAKSRENRNQEKKPLAKRSKNANAQDHKKEEILDFDHINIKRETSMSVSTPEAEIWSISIREFFTKLEHHKTELDMVIAYITEKKRRLNVRINTIMQNSQEYVGFLQSQNSAAALKKDVNMKTNTLTHCSTTTQSKEKLIEEPANNQSSKPNLKSTQKVWLLPDKTPEDNQSSIKKLKKDNSITQSLQKDDSNNNNKSIYDILNKQESINSNITTSWSPPKLVLTKSKTVAGRSSSNINRRLKSFKETKQTEKSETLEDDVDPNTSLDKSAIKPDKNIVNEIRTFHPTQVLNSRTAYIGYAVERRATINEKLQEKVLIRQTTDPDTCPEIENLRLVPKAVAEPKWRVMAYRHQSRKPSTAQQEMDTSNPNIKFRDESRLIVNYYKKITKVDLNGSALGPDQSREEANRSRPDLNASRRSFQGVTLNASGSKTDISQSKADYYSPKIDSNNASAIKPVSVFEPEKYKLNVSERFLGADGNETAFQAKAKLESLLLVGKKNSKEDNKYSRETGDQKRCYVSGLFPGFRPKTFIKRDVDAGELYRQNLKSEAERRLTRAFRDVNKTLNTSADQVPGERLNKSVVNEVEAMLAKELKLLSKGQKNY